MTEASIICVDLAKRVFQLHGTTTEGEVVFRKKPSRKQFVTFMQIEPGCDVALQACGTTHFGAAPVLAGCHLSLDHTFECARVSGLCPDGPFPWPVWDSHVVVKTSNRV